MSKSNEIKVMAKPQGRIQRSVLEALQQHPSLTTTQLAQIAYGRDGEFENHDIIRAINGLIKRGFNFIKVRKGLVNRSGYVYLWSLN
ncbi:hypothetical protein FHS77_002801 [Paenochrobactrum gallinarii]|uniref:Helix-turn-helix domain-containing protein n=1 Tax=Paenochrobactrum gallinarii TaxID=643673 RepID=A0A841M382_9HYPH|nr:hypothetical protein [Paenochrobactrum gallinarii]MBB6262229.1 hypothetical protein [Paenochrobactrum gallinarii]